MSAIPFFLAHLVHRHAQYKLQFVFKQWLQFLFPPQDFILQTL